MTKSHSQGHSPLNIPKPKYKPKNQSTCIPSMKKRAYTASISLSKNLDKMALNQLKKEENRKRNNLRQLGVMVL